jgi:hypothetical protein
VQTALRVLGGVGLAALALGYLFSAAWAYYDSLPWLVPLASLGAGLNLALAACLLLGGPRLRAGLRRHAVILTLLNFVLLGAVGCMDFLAGIEKVNRALDRPILMNQLKLLAVALRDYGQENGTLPPAAEYSPEGRPLLSWRVLVLPYLEEDSLYRQFRLDEAWDGPHNKALLAKMPQVYEAPGGRTPHERYGTYFRVLVGPGASFEGRQGVPLTDFTDGLSQTILVAEAGEAVPWTKPDELPFAPGRPLPALGGVFGGGFDAAMADASVVRIDGACSEATLRALITRKAGDRPGNDW